MKIELLNVRIFISKSTVVTDAIGNRRNEWKPFYTCYATVSGEAGKICVAMTCASGSSLSETPAALASAMALVSRLRSLTWTAPSM